MAVAAVAALIDTSDVQNPVQNINPDEHHEFVEYTNYQAFFNYGWETLYKKYMSNVIKILNIHGDICRLFLLHELYLSSNNMINTLIKIQTKKIIRPPVAVELTNNLKDMLSDSDPIYLEIIGEYFAFDQPGLYELIELVTTGRKSYPKLHEYEEHLKIMKIVKSLTVEFKIEDFLQLCPDPVDYFKSVKLNSSIIHYDESISYLSEKFNDTSIGLLRTSLAQNKFNLTDTVEALKNRPNPILLKTKRRISSNPNQISCTNSINVEFLKEVAFINHKEEILNYIENEKATRKVKFEEAKSMGNLNTCECCYNDELLSSEVFPCPAGHRFCSSCIKKGIEVAVGDNNIDLKCFASCNQEFSETIIKQIIDDKLFQRIMRLKQAKEIKAASIDGLETCAFCDYSVILSPDLKIIFCMNPDCKKQTCRECREESHTPLRCDQIEQAPEVKVRTMIEDKMTDVLVRTCYNCNNKFVKDDGCNKMTCTCGKRMCYICRKPVDSDYEHFYNETMLKDKCPLYTDQNIVHERAVETAAMLTLNELKNKQPELLGKIDIDKLLPQVKKHNGRGNHSSKININELLATVTGQKVEDIDKLDDIRSLEPQNKKAKR